MPVYQYGLTLKNDKVPCPVRTLRLSALGFGLAWTVDRDPDHNRPVQRQAVKANSRAGTAKNLPSRALCGIR